MSEPLQSGRHPDADQLSAFVEHALPAHEQQETLAHLAECARCRSIVALSLPPVEEKAFAAPPVRPGWFERWRLVWAAAPALAVLALLLVHVRPFTRHIAEPQQIAASRPAPATPAFGAPRADAAGPRLSSESRRAATASRDTARVATHAVAPAPQASPAVSLLDLPVGGRSVLPPGAIQQPEAPAQALLPRGGTTGGPAPVPGLASSHGSGAGFGAGSGVGLGAAGVLLALPPPQPLPSNLPVLSMVRYGQLRLALDAQDTLYLSQDEGRHWQAVPVPWPGRAVRVSLAGEPPVILSQRVFRPNKQASHGVARTPAALASAPGAAAGAQPPRATASLTGTIKDATGAVIPGATVTATDPAKSSSRAVMTGPDGRYRIPDLPVAVYKVEAQAPGFLTQSLTTTLTPAQPSVADLTLTIGHAAQTVAVQASPAPVELQAAPPVTAKIVPQNSTESAAPIFEITTETGEHWTSTDGLVWKRN